MWGAGGKQGALGTPCCRNPSSVRGRRVRAPPTEGRHTPSSCRHSTCVSASARYTRPGFHWPPSAPRPVGARLPSTAVGRSSKLDLVHSRSHGQELTPASAVTPRCATKLCLSRQRPSKIHSTPTLASSRSCSTGRVTTECERAQASDGPVHGCCATLGEASLAPPGAASGHSRAKNTRGIRRRKSLSARALGGSGGESRRSRAKVAAMIAIPATLELQR